MNDLALLENGLKEMGISVLPEQLKQFELYTNLLLEWNEKFNLTAITKSEEIAVEHYLDSASLLTTPFIREGRSIVDMGTGAGFPGVPVKILMPGVKLVLVDSLKKRTVFLEELVSRLNLKDVEVVHGRAEEVGQDPNYRGKFDLAVSRAVAELRVLCEYCLPLVCKGGYFIALKGPGAYQEVEDANRAIRVLGGQYIDTALVKVPFSERIHNLVIVKKALDTPASYPRKAGKPKKSPL